MKKDEKARALVSAIADVCGGLAAGHPEPKFDEVAARAGVSVSTAFRIRKHDPAVNEAWHSALDALKKPTAIQSGQDAVTKSELRRMIRVLASQAEVQRVYAERLEVEVARLSNELRRSLAQTP